MCCMIPSGDSFSLHRTCIGWLVVLGFNAHLTAKVISWRSETHMCFLAFSHQYKYTFSFQSHRLLFSHASAEVRGENTPEGKFTGDRTHNHHVISLASSPPSHSGVSQNMQPGSVFTNSSIDRLMAWCLTPFSTVFQLYHGGQCNYPCFPGLLLTSSPQNFLSKPLAAFPYNHCRNNGQQ